MPSVLRVVATTLVCTLGAVAAADPGVSAFVVPAGQGAQRSVVGQGLFDKITALQSGGSYYVFEIVSPTGAGVPPHNHSREDEVVYVAEGRFAVTLGDRTVEAEAGSILHMPRGTPHGFANVGDTEGRTIWFVTPGDSFAAFFDELSALPPGEPDRTALAALFAKYGVELVAPPG